MNLIEALKQADGKPVARKKWGESGCTVSLGEEKIVWGNRAAYGMYCNDLLADDWYVVEPKSKIEEAIEREDYDERNNPVSTPLKSRMRRIVNIALDEAAKVTRNTDGSTCECPTCTEVLRHIHALKVKE